MGQRDKPQHAVQPDFLDQGVLHAKICGLPGSNFFSKDEASYTLQTALKLSLVEEKQPSHTLSLETSALLISVTFLFLNYQTSATFEVCTKTLQQLPLTPFSGTQLELRVGFSPLPSGCGSLFSPTDHLHGGETALQRCSALSSSEIC